MTFLPKCIIDDAAKKKPEEIVFVELFYAKHCEMFFYNWVVVW